MNKINVKINDRFWNERIAIIQKQMLPFQWRVLNDQEPDTPKSGAIMNFKIAAGEAEGEYWGMVFQDTDLYKWLEAVAYSLAIKDDDELRGWAEEAIRLIAAAQKDDGYVNTYFQVFKPELQWTDLTDNHELYCFGHLIEAGVAYHEVTGDQTILSVITKAADMLADKFGYGKEWGLPGHPEVELALLRLYHLTENERYLELAKYFILERGKKPNFFIEEPKKRTAAGIPSWLDIMHDGFVVPEFSDDMDVSYYVANKQLIDQMVVEGHAVRAGYLYTALADLAAIEGDLTLKDAAQRLFDNCTTKNMYITGGIGQTHRNEGFTRDYDLPNATDYCETCAGISLIFWAQKMLMMETDSKYADTIERVLYNNTLGSMALDGKSFYYSNLLEKSGDTLKDAARPKWYACACCPPNLARLVLSLDQYLCHYQENGDVLFIDQYIGGEIKGVGKAGVYELAVDAAMPWDGEVRVVVKEFPQAMRLGLRIPEWAKQTEVMVNDKYFYEGVHYTVNRGYIIFFEEIKFGDVVTFAMALQPRLTYANVLVKENIGKAAITRGPLVYCLEQEDCGNHLWQLQLQTGEALVEEHTTELNGIISLHSTALRSINQVSHSLYCDCSPATRPEQITAIPYYARYNRSIGELQVWTRVGE